MKKAATRLWETLLWGGTFRERALLFFLSRHYRSLFRRTWNLSDRPPLHEIHRGEWFSLGFDAKPNSVPGYFARGFYAAECIRPGDRVLDIGCGDGFFSKRFLASTGAQVDALDIDPGALTVARRFNPDPHVRFWLTDATETPFPSDRYEVVVWDGALAHFPAETTQGMLRKIASVLSPDGIFVGSESLGREDHGHRQFFDHLGDLEKSLRPHFTHCILREWSYPINGGSQLRREAFWRCAQTVKGIRRGGWMDSGKVVREGA